jgi:hypothetical protein
MRRHLAQQGFGADRGFRWPLQLLNGRVMGARIRHAATTSAQEPSPSRGTSEPQPRR